MPSIKTTSTTSSYDINVPKEDQLPLGQRPEGMINLKMHL